MFEFRTFYWPIFTSFWLAATFVISYIIAVSNGHVYPFFPFISDTGTTPPESCIFGQLLNFGALFMAVLVYIRSKYVKIILYKVNNSIERWNFWANLFGYLASLGISLVANFQETEVGTIHFLGAIMAFGIGTIYFIIQAYITWLSDSSKCLKYSRICLCVITAPLFICNVVVSNLSFQQFDGIDQLQWDSNDKGYDLRLISTISEWFQALFMCIYIISFTNEFKEIEFAKAIFEKTNYL